MPELPSGGVFPGELAVLGSSRLTDFEARFELKLAPLSQAAFVAHGTSDAFKAIGASLRNLAGGRPEITVLKPIGGKGL